MFHTLNQEITIPHNRKVPVAVGMATALDGSMLDATDFHGTDGLGDVHKHLPHTSSPESWMSLFEATESVAEQQHHADLPFVPTNAKSYEEINRILAREPAGEVIIVALGPLMNIAKAAELDPVTFSRVRQVVSMGGTLDKPGNVTPYAEFNVFSDALAAKRVYELTSLQSLGIKLTLFPLDITSQHNLLEPDYLELVDRKGYEIDSENPKVLKKKNSGDDNTEETRSLLLEWCHAWLSSTFDTYRHIYGYDLLSAEEIASKPPIGLEMHDPLALYYALTEEDSGWEIEKALDIRVEASGEYTQGMTVYDRRSKPKRKEPTKNDHSNWLLEGFGNRVDVARASPMGEGAAFGLYLLKTVFE